MRQLRPGPDRARLPDRGAEDRQEGAEGADVGREEEIEASLPKHGLVHCGPRAETD